MTADEWQRQIDIAIDEANVFIFVVTNGASGSDAIKHELERARNTGNKKILAFIDERIWAVEGEVTITLSTGRIDIKDFHVRQFNASASETLLREVTDSAQIVRIIKPE